MATSTQVRIPAQNRRLQIMEAAKVLFARQGLEGTTTRQIAQHARVNEAIIFRHFPTKEDLYWAIIDHECEHGSWQDSLEEQLRSSGSDREIFAAIGEDILVRRSHDSSLSRLLLFSALENPRRSQRFFQTYVVQYYEAIADYIRRRTEQGAFRRVDPLLAARGFVGMIVYHSLIQEIFGGKRYRDFDVKAVSTTLTDIWLGGMEVRNGHTPRRKTNK